MNRIYFLNLFFLGLVFSCNIKKTNRRQNDFTYKSVDKLQVLKNSLKAAYDNNDYKRSVSCLEQLVKIDSTNGEFHYKMAYCKAELYDIDGSTTEYHKAIKYNYKLVEANFGLGLNAELTFNESLAKTYFERCLKIDPSYEKAITQLRILRKHYGL